MPLVVVNAATIGSLPAASQTGQGWLIVALAAVSGLCVPPIVACSCSWWQGCPPPPSGRRARSLDDVAPKAGGAEAYTWLTTANGVGVAVGGLLAGVAIERSGTPAAFIAAAAAMAFGAALLVVRRDTLSVASRQR